MPKGCTSAPTDTDPYTCGVRGLRRSVLTLYKSEGQPCAITSPVLLPLANGKWRAHIPDFPGCKAEATSASGSKTAAIVLADAAAGACRQAGKPCPIPRTLEAIRDDETWWSEQSIDWNQAVVSMVAIAFAE